MTCCICSAKRRQTATGLVLSHLPRDCTPSGIDWPSTFRRLEYRPGLINRRAVNRG